jgi:hypothetical protein
MALKKLAAAAAMLAAATPSVAFDAGEAGVSTMFYISIPLDSRVERRQRDWSVGMQIQGRREHQAVRIDSTMLNAFSLNDIDAKWMVAGLVATGAAVAISASNKKTASDLQQQQARQQATTGQQGGGSTSPGQCPRPATDPCAK